MKCPSISWEDRPMGRLFGLWQLRETWKEGRRSLHRRTSRTWMFQPVGELRAAVDGVARFGIKGVESSEISSHLVTLLGSIRRAEAAVTRIRNNWQSQHARPKGAVPLRLECPGGAYAQRRRVRARLGQSGSGRCRRCRSWVAAPKTLQCAGPFRQREDKVGPRW